MPAGATAAVAFATGLVAVLLATPIAMRVAVRTGFLDRPVGYKEHGRPTPYLGGSAVLAAVLVVAFVLGDGTGRFAPLVLGALLLWAVGTVDDKRTLSPGVRVVAAVLAAVGLWAGDLGWSLFGNEALNLLITVVWILGLVNAFNLNDNLDGATGAVAGAAMAGVAAFALIRGDVALAALGAGTVGICAGFLRFNLARPARIFLGDGGSMPVGFLVAGSAIAATDSGPTGLGALLCAALLVGLVILDTTLVCFSRRRRGVSLLQGGRDHLTHRTLAFVGTPRAVAAVLATTQLILCAISVGAAELGRAAVLWSAAAVVVAGIGLISFFERRPVPGKASTLVTE